jgi:hypothetical protein
MQGQSQLENLPEKFLTGPPAGGRNSSHNEEGCIRRADAGDRLPPGRCRPAGYKPVELSRDWHGLCFMEIE